MTDADFLQARDLLLAGEAKALAAVLAADPALVHSRYQGAEPPYNGYFHRPTLLHHVAGNPTIATQPTNDRALADLLLAHGAELDAITVAGPDQPGDIGWLLEHGADPELRDTTCGATPREWAEHCGRSGLAPLLP